MSKRSIAGQRNMALGRFSNGGTVSSVPGPPVASILARPSAVRGPVLIPPWNLHRPSASALARSPSSRPRTACVRGRSGATFKAASGLLRFSSGPRIPPPLRVAQQRGDFPRQTKAPRGRPNHRV